MQSVNGKCANHSWVCEEWDPAVLMWWRLMMMMVVGGSHQKRKCSMTSWFSSPLSWGPVFPGIPWPIRKGDSWKYCSWGRGLSTIPCKVLRIMCGVCENMYCVGTREKRGLNVSVMPPPPSSALRGSNVKCLCYCSLLNKHSKQRNIAIHCHLLYMDTAVWG